MDSKPQKPRSRFPLSLPENMITLLLAAGIGVVAALGALLFRTMILGVETVFWGTPHLTFEFFQTVPWYTKLAVPMIGALLLAPIVVRWAPQARGSGIPEVIEAVALKGGAVPRRIVPFKMIAAALCIGSGGSAGREGPIVHVGAAVGSWIGRSFHSTAAQAKTYVGCGAAGGIAATFNTPFAGALFAVEVVLGDFGAVRIAPIVIASIVATVVSRHFAGDFPHIEAPVVEETLTLVSIVPFIWLGIAASICSAMFIKMMKTGWELSDKWKFSPYLLPMVGAFIVGSIGIFFPQVFGVGYDTLNKALVGELSLHLLFIILIVKMVATSATLTTGGSGGVFAPSLLLGAVLGSLVGKLVEHFTPGLYQSPHIFPLVGMGAMVAGTTRAPISAILVIFELTYQPAIILPLMTACIPSVLISSYLHSDSIYHAKLKHRGVEIEKQGELNLLKGKPVSGVMKSRVGSISPQTSLMELVDRFLESSWPVIWMVDSNGKLTGFLESQNLKLAMHEKESLLSLVLAEDIAAPVPLSLKPDDDLSFAMKLFSEYQYDILPVVDPETGQVVGDLMRNDIIYTYTQELAQRDTIGLAVDAIGVADRLGGVDLGGGYAIVEYEVPAHLIGANFKDLDLRRKFGFQALLVKREKEHIVPGPDTNLQPGDVILFAGLKEDLETKLSHL